ncbi:MAG: AAA family ATPase [Alphaproteobacteria bacterium]
MRLGGSVNWSQKPGRVFETTDAGGPDPGDNRARSYPAEQIFKAFGDVLATDDLDIGGKPTDVQACIDNIKRGHHLHINSRDLIWQMVNDGVPTWVINTTMTSLLTPVSDGGTVDQVPSLIATARTKLEIPEPGRQETSSLELIDPRDWMTKATPERQWLVEDYIPMMHVTGFYGDGGSGKTLLTHQLLTSVATGKDWLGMPVRQMRGIGFFCEDYEDDLHINQDNINYALGLAYSDLGDMRVISRVGEDNILMSFINGNKGERTALFEQLLTAAQEFGAQFVLIDTLADTFDGNENVRGQARQFIANVCGRIAREIEGVIVVCAHPSIAGMKSGDGYGGNTAWSNTVRSRLYLSRAGELDDADADPNERVLSRKKANYSGLGEDLPLVWFEGVLLPNDHPAKAKEIDTPTQNQMLIKIQSAWDNGTPYAEGANSARFVGNMLGEPPFNVSKKRAKKLLGQWLIDGRIRSEMIDSKWKTRGLKVIKWFE